MSETFNPEWFSLKGKTAIVTGGVGILGKPFCRGLAEFGANVAVVDLDESKCRAFADELIKNHGIKAVGVACDVTSPEAVARMVEQVVNAFGEINILHNNAGGKSSNMEAYFAPFEEYSLEEWRNAMSVNIDGMFLVAQAVGKQMVKQGKGGSIVQTASIYGAMAPDQRIYEGSFYYGRAINTPAVYSASKAAVIGLTRYLATYWANKGIRVNSICPGGVESGQNEEFQMRYSARIPMGRMAQANEMVGALVYLASDASSYITGQNLLIDGGLSAW
ncbi:SDR family oxidoreductase [Candidatus Ferrigenium straubiae]|jgi:NAD(P)-dependent dehydrogenase (short-subunit alcohol dehydrogenase family)|uniref:SDR family oxidoreductase n=1 Tax=Candidatus Ferrigenium straubiae TaxID=2919506 RepID=UPI003F4ACD4F